MKPETRRFRELAVRSLGDPALRQAIDRATGSFIEARRRSIEEVRGWEDLRRAARDIRLAALEHLDDLLEELRGRIEARGGHVHHARDASQARETVLRIARDAGVRLAVKSKSMTTEEIGLNGALSAAGIEVVETDLGEYIVQLAGEPPSHIVTPAIHKSRGEIARLFAEKLGGPMETEIPGLTRRARDVLRAKFLRATMGVSGANVAVAETGTIVIVENEGNARCVTTLPGTHVVVMGIEKVIRSFDELAVLLRVLPRSGTGQRMTSYVSFIEGPRSPEEEDGPESFHLVLLDNGRSRIRSDPEMRPILSCIRCGACLNVCPVYRQIGGHAYGWVYPGPVGAVLTPLLLGHRLAPDHAQASTLCGACTDVCPVMIDLAELLLRIRSRQARRRPLAGLLARVWAWVMASHLRYRVAQAAGRRIQWAFRARFLGRRLPLLGRWLSKRDLVPIADRPFWKRWADGAGRDEAAPCGPYRPGPGAPARETGAPASSPSAVPAPPKAPSPGEVLARLRAEVEHASGEILEFDSPEQVREVLAPIIEGVRTVRDPDPVLDALGLDGLGVRLLSRGPAGRAELEQADVGITSAEWVLAETGTIAISGSPGRHRGTSLLPPVHIAIVPRERILWSAEDLLRRMQAAEARVRGASYFTWITGPSRTADIEKVLTIGVHGPGRLCLVVLGGRPPGP